MSFSVSNQTIVLFKATSPTVDEIQYYQDTTNTLVIQKERYLEEKEAALNLLQKENIEAAAQVKEMMELFKQTLAEHQAEKAVFEQRILNLESERMQVINHKDMVIQEQAQQIELLKSSLQNSEKRVEGLKGSLKSIETLAKSSLQHWNHLHVFNVESDSHLMSGQCFDSFNTNNAIIAEVTKSSTI